MTPSDRSSLICDEIRARDLGDGPHKDFGSALGNNYAGKVERCPMISRTVKPRFLGTCPQCGERRWFCDCEGEAA